MNIDRSKKLNGNIDGDENICTVSTFLGPCASMPRFPFNCGQEDEKSIDSVRSPLTVERNRKSLLTASVNHKV